MSTPTPRQPLGGRFPILRYTSLPQSSKTIKRRLLTITPAGSISSAIFLLMRRTGWDSCQMGPGDALGLRLGSLSVLPSILSLIIIGFNCQVNFGHALILGCDNFSATESLNLPLVYRLIVILTTVVRSVRGTLLDTYINKSTINRINCGLSALIGIPRVFLFRSEKENENVGTTRTSARIILEVPLCLKVRCKPVCFCYLVAMIRNFSVICLSVGSKFRSSACLSVRHMSHTASPLAVVDHGDGDPTQLMLTGIF